MQQIPRELSLIDMVYMGLPHLHDHFHPPMQLAMAKDPDGAFFKWLEDSAL